MVFASKSESVEELFPSVDRLWDRQLNVIVLVRDDIKAKGPS